MTRNSKDVGSCPRCDGGEAVCSYNFFDRNGLTIHSWEHKCGNCGMRETTAYRSDEDDELDEDGQPRDLDIDREVCPYCERRPG